MAKMQLPDDFRDFFKFLNKSEVENLLIGGWAVGCHGHPRATADMDIWVACDPENARRIVHHPANDSRISGRDLVGDG